MEEEWSRTDLTSAHQDHSRSVLSVGSALELQKVTPVESRARFGPLKSARQSIWNHHSTDELCWPRRQRFGVSPLLPDFPSTDLPSLSGLSRSRFSPDTSLFCRYCKWHPIPIFTFELFPASVWAAIDFVSVGVLAFCPAALLELFTRGSGLFLWLRVSQCPLGFVICKNHVICKSRFASPIPSCSSRSCTFR